MPFQHTAKNSRITQIFLIMAALIFTKPLHAQTELDSLMQQLEKTISERAQYDHSKAQHIAETKKLLKESKLKFERRYDIQKQLIREYEAYTFDSALHYLNKNLTLAQKIQNPALVSETRIALAGLLASSGLYKEAIDILGQIHRADLPEIHLEDYYYYYRKLYSELSFYTHIPGNDQNYASLYKSYTDSLLAILDPKSDKYLDILETQLLDTRKLQECRTLNTRRLSLTNMGTREYSKITFNRSQTYEVENNTEMQKKFLILSAISDLKASVKDNASLATLAIILFRENDIEHAHSFINIAFKDAEFFNSRLRFIEISNIFPVITTAYQLKSNQQTHRLRLLLVGISTLGLILIFAIIYIYRQLQNLAQIRNKLLKANTQYETANTSLQEANKKLNNLNFSLTETNHIKEQYIANFLNICSEYIDKLDLYRKMVQRMIHNRKIPELLEATQSPTFIEHERQEYYNTFDTTFLSIYPNFIEEFNKLLLPEKRIVPKTDELLNTELRIFALIRLGISDSSKIAKLLNYSVNTIYNYRAKIKNKAIINRDNFEESVMLIDSMLQNPKQSQ